MLNQAIHDLLQGNTMKWVIGLLLTHKPELVLLLGELYLRITLEITHPHCSASLLLAKRSSGGCIDWLCFLFLFIFLFFLLAFFLKCKFRLFLYLFLTPVFFSFIPHAYFSLINILLKKQCHKNCHDQSKL